MKLRSIAWFIIAMLWLSVANAATVEVNKGRLTVQAKNTALREVLQRIEAQSDLEVAMMGDAQLGMTLVSEEFSDLPLEEGVARLLSDWNYALITDEETGALRKLFILSARSVTASVVETPLPSLSLPDPNLQPNPPTTAAADPLQDDASAESTAITDALLVQLVTPDAATQITALATLLKQPTTDPAVLAEVRRLTSEADASVQGVALEVMVLYDTSDEARQILMGLVEQADGPQRDFALQHLMRMKDEAKAVANETGDYPTSQ